MGCVQSYFRKAHTAGLSPSSTHGSEKAGIPQDATADVADLVDYPEKEPLDVTDIQNENDINLTEKNESAPEPNGTIKTDDDGATKAIATATVTAAVVGAISAAKAATNDASEKEETETGEISTQKENNVTSPDPKLGTEKIGEGRGVKSPESVEPEDGDVVTEMSSRSGSTTEENEKKEESRPPSTALRSKDSEITEEAPIEPVPDDRPSTAKSDTTLEQGSRPASASQTVESGENDYSRPKSGINYEAEGTRPISASSIKDNLVPGKEPDEEGVMTPSTNELARSRPDSSVEQKTETQQEIQTENSIDTNKVEDRPSSVLVAEETVDNSEQPIVKSEVDTQVESHPSTAADVEQATDDQIYNQSDQKDIQPVNSADSVKENRSRPSSVVELTEEGIRPASTVVDGGTADLTTKENIPLSATENEPTSRSASAAESTKEDKSRPGSAIEPIKEENVSASFSKDSEEILEEQTDSRPDSVAASAIADGTGKRDIPDETVFVEDENQSIVITESVKENISRPTSSIQSTKEKVSEEEGSKPLTSAESNEEGNEEPDLSRPVSMPDSVQAEVSRADNVSAIEDEAVRPVSSSADNVEVQKQSEESQSLNGVESTDIEQKENRPESSLVANTEDSEGPALSEPVNDIPPVKEEEERFTSTAIDSKQIVPEELESQPISVTKSAEGKRSRPISEAESNKEENELAIAENKEITQAQECIESRPGSAEKSTKQETSRPVSVTSSAKGYGPEETNNINDLEATKEGGSRPVSAELVTEVNIPATTGQSNKDGESRPVSATEVANEGEEAILDGTASSTKEEENEAVAFEESTKEENRLVSEAAPIQKDASRPASTEELSKEENSNEHFPTHADEQNVEVSAAELIKDENRPVTKSSKDEGSRPPSSAELAREKNESSHDEEEDNENMPVSTGKPTKEGEIRPVSVADTTKESGSRPISVTESANEKMRTTGVEEPTTGGSRQASASELVKIEDRPISGVTTSAIEEVNRQSPTLQNAENSLQLKESRPVSVTESNKDEGNRPNSSVEIEQSSEEKISSEMIKDNEISENNIFETKFQEDEAIEKVEETDIADYNQAELTKSASSVEEQEDAVKEASRPSSSALSNDVKEEGDGSSTAEVQSDIVYNAKNGADVALEDASKENIQEPAVKETNETNQSPSNSFQFNRGAVPSLTVTEAADEPGSDNETDQPLEEIKNIGESETVETQEESPVEEDGTNILNTAATTIQASFRGYNTRKALNNDAEIEEEPQSPKSHDSQLNSVVQDIAEPSEPSVSSEPENTETEEKQELGNELQKPQECDEIPVTQKYVTEEVIESEADSSLSTAATKIQAGVRGFLTRRHIQHLKTSNSTTAPSIGDSQQSLGDTITSPDEEEDEGVQTSGSMETEVQKQHNVTMEEDEVSEFQKETVEEVQKGLSLDSQLDEKKDKTPLVRSAISLQLDGPVNDEEDTKIWQTLQQEQLEDAATKIQSNYRGYRARRSLKREDAIQMPTTSTSTTTASSDAVPLTIRHSGEFHDMVVLPEEDAIDASTSVSRPIQ